MKDLFRSLDEPSRRAFLLYAAKTTLGVSMVPSFLAGAEKTVAPAKGAKKASCERVIFLYMRGGMSQIDTFDPKDSQEIGGPSRPIATQSADLQLSDKLPKLAMQGKDLSVVRSMTTKTGHTREPATPCIRAIVKERASLIRNSDHGPKCFWKSDPILPSSVVIASGNPGPRFPCPDYSPLPIGNAARGIKDLLRPLTKRSWKRESALPKASLPLSVIIFLTRK